VRPERWTKWDTRGPCLTATPRQKEIYVP
jgi:hypothetical protein